jgi:hypothetical protein
VRRRPLDQQRQRQQDQAAGDQLPGDQGEHVDGRGPALDQHESERRDDDRAEGREQAHGVELAGRAQHQEADAHQPDPGGGQADEPRALPDQQGGEPHHRQR